MPISNYYRNCSQRVRFRVMAIVADGMHFIGLGISIGKTIDQAKPGALRNAKLNIVQLHLGNFQENDDGEPHTSPLMIYGREKNVSVMICPQARGTGIKGPPMARTMLSLTGIKDCTVNITGEKSFSDPDIVLAIFQNLTVRTELCCHATVLQVLFQLDMNLDVILSASSLVLTYFSGK